MPSSSSAWCGWVPTEQYTFGYLSAIESNASRRLTRVEIVTIRPMPAVSARATMPSRSSAKSGKSRWQWLSTSIAFCRLRRRRFDIARKHRGWRRKHHTGLDPVRQRSEVARIRIVGDTENIEQLARGLRHRRLGEDGDLAHHFGRYV